MFNQFTIYFNKKGDCELYVIIEIISMAQNSLIMKKRLLISKPK